MLFYISYIYLSYFIYFVFYNFKLFYISLTLCNFILFRHIKCTSRIYLAKNIFKNFKNASTLKLYIHARTQCEECYNFWVFSSVECGHNWITIDSFRPLFFSFPFGKISAKHSIIARLIHVILPKRSISVA